MPIPAWVLRWIEHADDPILQASTEEPEPTTPLSSDTVNRRGTMRSGPCWPEPTTPLSSDTVNRREVEEYQREHYGRVLHPLEIAALRTMRSGPCWPEPTTPLSSDTVNRSSSDPPP